MKKLLAASSLLLTSFIGAAQVTPEWIRHPAISPDGTQVVFTYKGDLYLVASSGGEAKRLTFHEAHDFNAIWSNDGERIAFASHRYGNFDVFVMDAEGGQATRLTYHSNDELPEAFSNDDSAVVFRGQRMDTADHRSYPSTRIEELYSVPSQGGRVSQLLTMPAQEIEYSKDNDFFLYQDRKGYEDEFRKHHRSAVTRDIWRYDIDKNEHTQLTTFEGEDRDPELSDDGKTVFYLSDESGVFNVHSFSLNRPKRTKQLTDFDLHPVRFLSHGNGKLAFSQHGELYTMTTDGKPSKVSVTIRTQDVANSVGFESVNGNISEMSVSSDGKQIAFVANGDVFVTSTDGAFTKQLTETPATEAFVSFVDDDNAVMYSSERDGKWSVFKTSKVREAQEPFFYAASKLQETSVIENEMDNYQAVMSPDGKSLAFVEDRLTLKVMDMESGEVNTLIPATENYHFRAGDVYFQWSPDSQWVLFQHDKLLNNADIAIVKADGSESFKTVVPSGYYDYSPRWADEGKQIIWFSNRDGLRSYANSGQTQSDVYSLFLTKDGWDEFRLSEDDYELMLAIEEANEAAKEEAESQEESAEETDESSEGASDETSEEESVAEIAIDWKGLSDRVARLTIHSSGLADAVLNKDADTLYYLTAFEGDYNLWQTDLRTQETKKAMTLEIPYGSLKWDPAMENLYLLSSGRISILNVGDGSRDYVSVDARMEVDTNEVYQADFEHVWLRTQKAFYEPTMHGVDWKKMYDEYKPKVAHVGTPYDFKEILAELLGELNISHSGARYSVRQSDGDQTASLGIFYDHSFSGPGIKITEVIEGGPLDKASLDIKAGMVITEIDGESVGTNTDWHALLNHKADKFTLISLQDGSGETVEYTVKPTTLRGLRDILYQRFVDINEREVVEKSKGQLGYVHIPGMSDGPYRNVFDTMLGKHLDKKGMVVDTRFNGGGDLVGDLAMFFTGEPFLTYATEMRVVGGEPHSRYTKPIAGLFNEEMYSDGHCYASGFRDLDLGISVGMPVPGTCSFAGWERLPSGVVWGMTPISAKNKKGEWLENNQTSPEIIIKNLPKFVTNGQDRQLEVAVKELLDKVD